MFNDNLLALKLLIKLLQLGHPQQLGFKTKQNKKTVTANCHFIENIKSFLDGDNVVGAGVNHDILLSKLFTFNFSKQAVDWFRSYLQT